MFVPIGDSPNLPRTPWLTWGLITVNVLIHVALWPLALQPASDRDPALRPYLEILYQERGALPREVSKGDLVRFEYGYKPRFASLRDAWTAMFLHAGFLHLLGNMLFLWIFGDNVEHRLGWLGFLLAYLATGLAATFGDALLRPDSAIPSVGASGAISGVLGLYFVWFPHNRVRVWIFLFPFLMDVIELKARYVLLAYVILNNLLPLLFTGGQGGVAYGAHLGGFAAGWALAKTLDWSRARTTPRQRPSFDRERQTWPLARHFRDALDDARLAEATSWLLDRPRAETRAQLPIWDKIALAEALEDAGLPKPALAVYQRALSDHPQGEGRSRAHLGAARVLLHGFRSPTAAYQHLYAALEEDPTSPEAQLARQYLAELQGWTRTLPRRGLR